MDRRDDAVAYFPVAIAGAVLGLGMMVGCGYVAYKHEMAGGDADEDPSYAMIEGRVAWAGWRTSAVREGPNRFLQIRFEDDHRGFLVDARDLPRAHRRRFERSGAGDDEILGLIGVTATVAVDSALLNEETPYMSGLRVGGETVIPVHGGRADSSTRSMALLLLYWGGTLLGVALLGASVQHMVVCVRYWRGGAV
jgi:hypothetical protein